MQQYSEVIKYLFELLPMYQISGQSAIKKDLTNIKALCGRLHDPQDQYPIIHIAGTNGKGTVSHLIAAMFQSMGYKTGLYTSPHYTDFRERIKINGDWISEAEVIDWVNTNRSIFEEIRPSFFEATVTMAFDHFNSQQVEIAIIETGLGGRLDSTNIVTPRLSVITQISLDHQQMLGDTIYKIAGEKAGIIKSKIPVVIGRHQSSCDHVFIHKADKSLSPISWASLNWKASTNPKSIVFTKDGEEIIINKPLQESPFLIENIATALESFQVYCKNYNINWDPATIANGLNNYRSLTKYIGRWQILNTSPLTIADSAHNEAAIVKLLQRAQGLPNPLHFVIGFVKDKELDKLLEYFPKSATYYFVQAQINRAVPAIELQEKGNKIGLKGIAYNSVEKGLKAAQAEAKINDMVFVTGSSFVVGDALLIES